jgi:membrane protein
MGTRGWIRLVRGSLRQIRTDNVPLLAGGVAFYAMLALVPALGAAVSLYGLVATRAQVDTQIASLTATLPAEARQLVTSQLRSITATSPGGLQVSFATGLAVALWSSASGMRWLLAALTAASGETEERGFLKLRSLALVMTLGAIVALGLSLGALLALPPVLDWLGLGGAARLVVGVLRFPALAALILGALAVLYRYGPDRPSADPPAGDGVRGRRDRGRPRWRWLTPGSVVAAVVWLVGSIGLSLYAANASKFDAAGTYGALGAVIVLLLWLWMSSFAVILGAVVNSQVSGPRP